MRTKNENDLRVWPWMLRFISQKYYQYLQIDELYYEFYYE